MTTTQKWLALSAVLIVIGLLWYYFIYSPPASPTELAADGPKVPPPGIPGTVSDPGVVVNTNTGMANIALTGKPILAL